MPLIQSCDPKDIEANIGELIAAGHEPAQAAAIAHSVCREKKRKDEADEMDKKIKRLAGYP